MRWVRKNWVTLLTTLIALGALGASIYALHLDSVHFKDSSELARTALEIEREHYQELSKQYEELTKPHTKHDEIYNRLVILDSKTERVQQNLSDLKGLGQDISEHQRNLWEAKNLRNQAELAWDEGLYSDADKFISGAHAFLNKIPAPPPAPAPPTPVPPPPPAPAPTPVSWWLVGAIASALICIGVVVWFIFARRRRDWRKHTAEIEKQIDQLFKPEE